MARGNFMLGGMAVVKAMADDENRTGRAALLIDAAKRCEQKAQKCLDEAARYREIANRILGGTAATPER